MLTRIQTFHLSMAMCSIFAGCNQSASVSNTDTTTTDQQASADALGKKGSPSNQGEWQATQAVLAGTSFPDAVTKGMKLSLSDTNYQVLVGTEPDKGTCQSDETVEPKQLTIRGTEGPNSGKTILAIYDFPSSEEMRVCYDIAGSSFPSEFTSTNKNGYLLVTYQRAK